MPSATRSLKQIAASIEANHPDNYNLAYAEYEIGNYQRSFTLSSVIDQEHIDAAVKDGVLSLTLPKVEPQAKKIAVQAA